MDCLNSLPLLSREEILRRMARMHGEPHVRRDNEVTRNDLAKWIGIDFRQVRSYERGKTPITDAMQIVFSQFFFLLDSGQLAIRFEGRKKFLERVPPPSEPPKPQVRPHVAFGADGPRLKFDTP